VKLLATAMAGLWIVEPEPIADERGWFGRTYDADIFARNGLETDWPQWSTSVNRRTGTVRGLHFQRPPYAETKLVACVKGAIHDVVVDLRPDSITYLQALGVRLDSDGCCALYIPAGFAHGFQTLEDDTIVAYHIDTRFEAAAAAGLRWNDPGIAVAWPLPISSISDKDRAWPDFVGRP
jgi:dTDP-4-dehydrorhamnose 3,5-epimerase